MAIHETGHAYVSYISGDKPSYITIESRGNFGGCMQHAADTAFQIVCTYGLEDDQLITIRREEGLQLALAGEYMAKVNEILKTEMKNALTTMGNAQNKIREIADVLMRESRLTGKQFEELMEADGQSRESLRRSIQFMRVKAFCNRNKQ